MTYPYKLKNKLVLLGRLSSLQESLKDVLNASGYEGNINWAHHQWLGSLGYTGQFSERLHDWVDDGCPGLDGGSASAPEAFTAPQWTASDTLVDGRVLITINSLPANGGAAITSVQYRIDGGSWVNSGGTSTFNINGLTDDVAVSVELRAVNSEGSSLASDSKNVTPASNLVPDAFVLSDWNLDNAASGGQLDVTINATPNDNGFTITDVEYRIDGGSWTSSGGVVSFNLTGLTNNVEVDVELRAVSSIGNSLASDLKSDTPTTGVVVPSAFTVGQWSVADSSTDDEVDVTINSLPSNGGAAITDVEYRIDAGSWISSGGTVSFSIGSLTAGVQITLELRAINSEGASLDSDDKTVTPVDNQPPAAFAPGDWTVEDALTDGEASVTILSLPSDNGFTITDVEYQVGAGSWVSTGDTVDFLISGLTNDVLSAISLRSINSIGTSASSASKNVTPTDNVAPVITSDTFDNVDTIDVTATEGGTLYWHIGSQSTRTAAEVKAGTGAYDSGNYAVSAGSNSDDITPEDVPGGSAYLHLMIEDSSGNQSAVDSTQYTFPDTLAPTLTSPVDAENGETASTGSVTTNEADGTLYWVVTTSGTTPTAAQIKLGQDNSSVAATDDGSQSVSSTGSQSLSPAPSGLTEDTSYTTHYMHEDSDGNQSTPVSASGFTTDAASSGITGNFVRQVMVPAPSGSSNTISGWDFEPGINVIGLYTGLGSNKTVTSVTLDGNTMTARATNTSIGTANQPLTLYEWDNGGSAGTGDLVVNTNATPFRLGAALWTLGDASFVSGSNVTDEAVTNLDLGVNTTAGDARIGLGFIRDNDYTPGTTPVGSLVVGFDTKDFDIAVEGTRYMIGANTFDAVGGTPESFNINTAELAVEFETIGCAASWRAN